MASNIETVPNQNLWVGIIRKFFTSEGNNALLPTIAIRFNGFPASKFPAIQIT